MHTYEGTENKMKLDTVGALALGPSGNLQGGVRCFSLQTGRVLHRFMKDITLLKMHMKSSVESSTSHPKNKQSKVLFLVTETTMV